MTNQSFDAPQESSSFDERVEILAKELELAVKWQRPCLLLVVYSSEYVRADVEAALENSMIDLGQKVVQLRIRNQKADDVISFLREFKDPSKAVFLVDGFRWGHDEHTSLYSTLNLQREFFVERQIRAVFWLTQNEIVALARLAPDFWAYRHRVIEFVDSPKAERLLQEALESAWQGTGEYADQYEDTDAKISLRESMLTELPEGEEASSTRANLLLTLGVLNWRKGDFEKADEQVQEALKIAEKIEDNWFEAECHNAIALIKTSTERIDEAIDAYKRAIRLAPDQIFAWNNLGNLCARNGRHDEAMVAFRKAVECNPRDPIAWNGLANLHFRIGYVDDAIAAYRKAIQYMPTFAQPWNGLGDVYASIGRSDEAMKAYHKAIDLNRHYVTPWIRLGVLFSRQERHREAIRAYQQAVALDPHNSLIWNELGMVQVRCEALDDAVASFLKAIDLDRGYGWAYSNLAYTYMLQGKYKQTVSLLLRSIDLLQADKDKAVSWNRLANVYRLLNEYDNAIAAYQMADQLEPGHRRLAAEDQLPEVSPLPAQPESSAEPDEAPTAAEAAEPQAEVQTESVKINAVEQEPTHETTPAADLQIKDAPAWIFGAGGESVKEGNEQQTETSPISQEAEERKETAMENSTLSAPADQPEDRTTEPPAKDAGDAAASLLGSGPDADAARRIEEGNKCFGRGAFEDAITAYNKAIQLDPLSGVAYSNLALTYLTQGKAAEAILLYQKSIDLLHTDAEKAVSWNGLGNAYRCVNDYSNAVAAYRKAAELDPVTGGIRDRADDFQAAPLPRDAKGWNDLGELFAKTGSTDDAIHAFQKAIELEPEAGQPYCNLAGALVNQNKYAQAVPLYLKSIDLLQDNKDKAAAWNRLGNVYRKLNDYDNAIKAYQKAVVLADEGVDLLTRARFSLLSNCYVNP